MVVAGSTTLRPQIEAAPAAAGPPRHRKYSIRYEVGISATTSVPSPRRLVMRTAPATWPPVPASPPVQNSRRRRRPSICGKARHEARRPAEPPSVDRRVMANPVVDHEPYDVILSAPVTGPAPLECGGQSRHSTTRQTSGRCTVCLGAPLLVCSVRRVPPPSQPLLCFRTVPQGEAHSDRLMVYWLTRKPRASSATFRRFPPVGGVPGISVIIGQARPLEALGRLDGHRERANLVAGRR